MSAANRVAYRGSQIRARVLWLVVAICAMVIITVWQRRNLQFQDMVLLFAIGSAYFALWLVAAIVNWYRAKSALASIAPGVAAAVDRRGIWLKGVGMPWPEIAQVWITPGRFGGSPALAVKRLDNEVVRVSLADLDVMPGTIDAAIRAYSYGNHWIDTSKLGN